MTDCFDRSIVVSTAHRPWPMPDAPWLMTQSWNGLLFAHWRVDWSQVRRAVPAAFDSSSPDRRVGFPGCGDNVDLCRDFAHDW
jgi:hypothetical protein